MSPPPRLAHPKCTRESHAARATPSMACSCISLFQLIPSSQKSALRSIDLRQPTHSLLAGLARLAHTITQLADECPASIQTCKQKDHARPDRPIDRTIARCIVSPSHSSTSFLRAPPSFFCPCLIKAPRALRQHATRKKQGSLLECPTILTPPPFALLNACVTLKANRKDSRQPPHAFLFDSRRQASQGRGAGRTRARVGRVSPAATGRSEQQRDGGGGGVEDQVCSTKEGQRRPFRGRF